MFYFGWSLQLDPFIFVMNKPFTIIIIIIIIEKNIYPCDIELNISALINNNNNQSQRAAQPLGSGVCLRSCIGDVD